MAPEWLGGELVRKNDSRRIRGRLIGQGAVGWGEVMELSEVGKVARLARLKLSEVELQDCHKQLGDILEYVKLLDEVDVTGVAPMSHPVPVQNVFREDVPVESLSRDEALQNACKTDGRFFLVPRILEEK